MIKQKRKAQQDIIVTVLLVLIALAAVAAVAYFVINNVKNTTNTASNTVNSSVNSITNCNNIDLAIVGTPARGTVYSSVVVTSKGGAVTADDIRIFVGGAACKTATTALAPGVTANITIPWTTSVCITGASSPAVGAKVEVAAVIGTSVCPISTSTATI